MHVYWYSIHGDSRAQAKSIQVVNTKELPQSQACVCTIVFHRHSLLAPKTKVWAYSAHRLAVQWHGTTLIFHLAHRSPRRAMQTSLHHGRFKGKTNRLSSTMSTSTGDSVFPDRRRLPKTSILKQTV